MKRIMLIGPSQCGKTSLTQCMRGEVLHYQKTRGHSLVTYDNRHTG